MLLVLQIIPNVYDLYVVYECSMSLSKVQHVHNWKLVCIPVKCNVQGESHETYLNSPVPHTTTTTKLVWLLPLSVENVNDTLKLHNF